MRRQQKAASNEDRSTEVTAQRVRKNHGKTTIYDAASAAGVSAISITRFFRSPHLLATSTKERIAKAVAELGYVPNQAAGALASTKSRVIASVIPSITNSVFAQTIHSLRDSLAVNGYQLLLATTDYSMQKEEFAVRSILSWAPAALVLTGRHHSKECEKLLAVQSIPIVEMWDSSAARPFTQVGFSHRALGVASTNYLIQREYESIWYVESGIAEDFRSLERQSGYEQALIQASKSPKVLHPRKSGPFDAGAEIIQLILLLKKNGALPKKLALLCANDHIAAGAILEANRVGLSIPKDLAIMGYGDFPIASALTPALTSIELPKLSIGLEVANYLSQALSQGSDQKTEPISNAPRTISLPWRLIERESA